MKTPTKHLAHGLIGLRYVVVLSVPGLTPQPAPWPGSFPSRARVRLGYFGKTAESMGVLR